MNGDHEGSNKLDDGDLEDEFMDSFGNTTLPLLSGSGGGCPALARQTIALQIRVHEEKARGRYVTAHWFLLNQHNFNFCLKSSFTTFVKNFITI